MKDQILQTKLQPPQVKGKILRRQRLINLLQENLDKRLILICADAGYGKTTLLAQFCAEFDKPFMFYDLDPSDNDLATFFNYLVMGIQRYYPDFGRRTRSVLPQTRNIEIIVGTFINEFVEHGTKVPTPEKQLREDFYIILDDYHHLQQNKEIGNALEYLLRHIPHNLHLIISSRSMPPLNLAYYFAKQELFEIKKEHLQFNIKEIQVLLKEIYNLKIPDAEIERIEKHSEGWITAIQLILQKVSVVGEEKAKETLNGYIASGEEIFDYFAREVFESQPKEVQEFLMKTSILEYLNPELCDNLLNSRKSNRILSYLASEHIFISKTNENYRYHPLFKEFLFKTLKSFSSAWQIRMLYRKAGMHFSKVGEYESAVNCYFFSEDYAKAAKILEKICDRLIVSGKFNTFMTLIGHLPAVILNKHSSLLLEKSRVLLFMGKWAEALKNLDKLKKYFKRKKDSKRLVEILDRIAFIYLVLMQPDKALVYAKRAYKLALNNRNLKAKIMLTFGNIYRAMGEYGKAENFLNSAFKIGDEKIKEQILDALARLYSEKTEFKKALESFSSLLTKEDPDNPDLRFAPRYANAAALFIEVHNFTKAKEFLVRAMNLARRFNDQRTIIYAIGIEGKLYLYQGNYQKAIDCYQRAIELNSQELKEKLLELYARIDLAYAFLGKKEISKAKSELKMVTDLLPPSTPPHILIDFWLIKGKMDIIDGDLNSAEKDLIQALRIAEESQQPFSKMVVFYELAKFYIEYNDKEKSFRFSKDCLEIASENNYDFFLIKKGKDDLSFFEFALKENINKDYLLSILEKIGTKETNQLCREIESKYDLEIQLFGNLIIKNSDGKILASDWKTRKAKSLFVYLILNQGKSIQKDSLIETFWKEKGLKEAQHNLHDHIFFVRKILKEILPKEIDVKKIIKYQSQFYTLSDEIKLKTDAIEFEKLITRASAMESSTKEKAIELYKQAFELYKNDFCPELYEDWAEEKRLYYRNEALKIAKRLAEYYYQNKDYDGSLSFYKRALQFDCCDETIHLGIIKCLVALGDKIGATRQYNEMEQILKKELDLSPSSETLKVYQELINSLK